MKLLNSNFTSKYNISIYFLKFYYMDKRNFDIAHYVWHKAMDELYKCYKIYTCSLSWLLRENWISMTFHDFKDKHDINQILNSTNIQNLSIDKIDYINSLHIWSVLSTLWKKEAEYCINTSIFFQIMMEADINDIISNSKAEKSFYTKWNIFLKDNNASSKENWYFDKYYNDIYKWVRNPIIHPKNKVWFRNINNYNFVNIYNWVKNWWFTFIFLLNKVHNYNINYEENWSEICKLHWLPPRIDNTDFLDIESLSKTFYNKHLTEFNKSIWKK